MTTALLTITHDEPLLLPRMLDSVRGLVDGPKIAFHIGEEDETPAILEADGFEVLRRSWDGFDGSWTEMFAYARHKADRLLYMQANHQLELDVECECGHPAHDGKCPSPPASIATLPGCGCTVYRPRLLLDPDVPSYMIRYRRGPYEYRLPNLLRGDVEWSISAPVHGVIEPDFFHERQPLDAIAVQESDADGRRAEKLARYLPICEKMVADDPDNPRAVFYLARTYFDFGRWDDAIEMYDRRIRMGGWDEEVWHAHYMKGVAQIRSARFAEGRNTLLAAYLRRPTRAEPLHAICKSMLPPDDLLFVEHEIYGSL